MPVGLWFEQQTTRKLKCNQADDADESHVGYEVDEIDQDAANRCRRCRSDAPGCVHLANNGALHLLLQHHRCRIDADVVGAEGHGLNDLDGKKHVDVGRPRHRDNAQRNKDC